MTELPKGLWNRAVIHWVQRDTVHRLWSELDILDTFYRYDELWRQERLWHGSGHQWTIFVLQKWLPTDFAWFFYLFLAHICRRVLGKTSVKWLKEVLSSHLASHSISRRSQVKGICYNKGLRQLESAPSGALWDGRGQPVFLNPHLVLKRHLWPCILHTERFNSPSSLPTTDA